MTPTDRSFVSQKLKRVNCFFNLGEITCINLKKIQVGFMLSMIEERDTIHHFFWNIVSFFYLASKINECTLKTSIYLDIFFFFFQKKQNNSIWLSYSRKIKIEKTLKRIIKTADRIFLKNTDFFFDITTKKSIIEVMNNLLRDTSEKTNRNFSTTKENFFPDNYGQKYAHIDLILERMDTKICYFWMKRKNERKNMPKRWWKNRNTRETELEFYELNYVYIHSIGKFKT
jgi:hypothetical protein